MEPGCGNFGASPKPPYSLVEAGRQLLARGASGAVVSAHVARRRRAACRSPKTSIERVVLRAHLVALLAVVLRDAFEQVANAGMP